MNMIHPFEKAGLGKAPFRFIGMGQQDRCYGEVILNPAEYARGGIAITTKPGGTCAYCGTAIINMYEIESSDRQRFHVGCDCVAKTSDADLIRVVAKAEKAHRVAKKANTETKTKTALSEMVESGIGADRPHPFKSFAADGKTLNDWARWMLDNGGASGQARALKALNASSK